MFKDVNMTNPKLGKELLNDACGQLPVYVWMEYFWQHSNEWKPVLAWCVDTDDPDIAPIDPQQAVDQAEPLVTEVIRRLMSNSRKEALEAAMQAVGILVQGSSEYQRGRGLAPSMRHQAVRVWVIRKFNPLAEKPRQSRVGFALLADKLFLKDGKCPRKIDSGGIPVRREPCGLTKHQYDSSCVKALETAVGNLKSAMKRDGIPI